MSPPKGPVRPTPSPQDGLHLGQQGLQPPAEGSILAAQLLVVGQRGPQPGLQPLQVLLLLPPRLAGRLPVLDHSLLPLQQLCLGTQMGQKENERWVGEEIQVPQLQALTDYPKLSGAALVFLTLFTPPERGRGCPSLLKHFRLFSQPLPAPAPQS